MNELVPLENINEIAVQSSGQISIVIAQMSDLMNDNCEKVSALASQNWIKRMLGTIFGKNRITLDEIRRNHEKLNAYMCEVISELYRRNCIDERIIISLGNQINELFAGHMQLKNMLGAFAAKLNEKIESVDNFHMLEKEIEQGVYPGDMPLASLIRIMSQYDRRVLNDRRKLAILRRAMTSKAILKDERLKIGSHLMSIMDIPDNFIGQIYLELETLRSNSVSEVILKVIENYHNLPPMTRRMKKKTAIISEIIESKNIDDSVMLSVSEIYDDLLETKIESVMSVNTNDTISALPAAADDESNEDSIYNEPEEDEVHDSGNNSGNISDNDVYDEIKALCRNFANLHGTLSLNDTYASLMNNLGISLITDEVYLSHDDSLFKRGATGFAIARSGIYCRDMFSSTKYTPFDALSHGKSEITSSNWNVYVNGAVIAYYTGPGGKMEDFRELFMQIADVLKRHGI